MSIDRMSWMRRITILSAAMFMLGLAGPSVMTATAQVAEGSYTTETGNHEITWAGEWEIVEDLTVEDDNLEAIFLSKDLVALTVAFLPADADLVDTRDILVESFQREEDVDRAETIDAGMYDNVAYALDRATVGGEEMGVFTLVVDRGPEVGTEAIVFVAPMETFATDLASARNEITVDGSNIFLGIDPAALQALLNETELATPAA